MYFIGIDRGLYLPVYPAFILQEFQARNEFLVGFEDDIKISDTHYFEQLQQSYIERLTKVRVHQPVFRARVLQAYETSCAICRLRHAELLDAAHIIPDGRPNGDPIVPNGLALCKIHHAAYDHNFIGIRPDGVIEVKDSLMGVSDGQMLLHGIQKIAGTQIYIPRARAAKPDTGRLEVRYEEFKKAG